MAHADQPSTKAELHYFKKECAAAMSRASIPYCSPVILHSGTPSTLLQKLSSSVWQATQTKQFVFLSTQFIHLIWLIWQHPELQNTENLCPYISCLVIHKGTSWSDLCTAYHMIMIKVCPLVNTKSTLPTVMKGQHKSNDNILGRLLHSLQVPLK